MLLTSLDVPVSIFFVSFNIFRTKFPYFVGSESGSSGLVKELRNDFLQEDLDFLTSRGPDAPYVVLLDTNLFRLSTLQALSRAGRRRIAGVVVLDDQTTQRHLQGHSADRSCPNEYFSLYTNSTQYGHCKVQKWNVGSKFDIEDEVDMFFHDFPFPMFMLRNQTEIDLLKNVCIINFSLHSLLIRISFTLENKRIRSRKMAKTCNGVALANEWCQKCTNVHSTLFGELVVRHGEIL